MKKNIATIAAVLFVLNLSAQFTVSETNAVDYPLKKKPTSQYFHFTDKDYFLLTYPDVVNPGYNLFVVDNAGQLKDKSEIEYDKGVFNNSKLVHSFHQLGNKLIAVLECHNKGEGKNRLVVRTLSGDGNLKSDDKEIGSMDYEKMMNPGDWFVYSTADKQHLAIISINPTEKEQPLKGKYYFLDASLAVLSSGDFTIGSEKKKRYSFKMLASDKGDFYLINNEFDQSYLYPVVYRKPAADKAFSEFAVMLPDPDKNIGYTAAIAPDGNLVLGGYFREKKFMTVGGVPAKGVWFYNTEKPAAISTQLFDKSITDMVPRGIVFNGNMLFLTGEQMLEEREARTAATMSASFEDNYNYKFGNIVVTGYDAAADTKFDLQLPRTFTARNIISDLEPAYAIVNGKYTLIYNDALSKYKANASSYVKVPVSVTVTNDGLMEQPVNYAKELPQSGYTLLPFYFGATASKFSILSSNGSEVKLVDFK
jgi:hypothetical protein